MDGGAFPGLPGHRPRDPGHRGSHEIQTRLARRSGDRRERFAKAGHALHRDRLARFLGVTRARRGPLHVALSRGAGVLVPSAPVRFGVLVLLAIAVLAGFGATWLERNR